MAITKEKIKAALDKAYKEAGQNAYFGNGFHAGVRFAEQEHRMGNVLKKVYEELTPESEYRHLFTYMSTEHDVILLENEMEEIIRLAEDIIEARLALVGQQSEAQKWARAYNEKWAGIREKAAMWEQLQSKVAACYSEGSDSNLCDIGEITASAFGYI